MLTGTPLDLTPLGSLLSGLGLLYWAFALGTAVLTLQFAVAATANLMTRQFTLQSVGSEDQPCGFGNANTAVWRLAA